MELEIISVNISEKKGEIKLPVETIKLTPEGIPGDAHAGKWHRQVSLLGAESFEKFSAITGREFKWGEFAENITTKGMVLNEMMPGDMLMNDTILMEVTQIGKKCHGDGCAIFRDTGACIMPKEGIFARVLKGGEMKAGDKLIYKKKTWRAGVITLSDRAYEGEYKDLSGPLAEELMGKWFSETKRSLSCDYKLLPDNSQMLETEIRRMVSEGHEIIITTGGTGIGPRDFTPDVVKPLLDKEIPGIMDYIRLKYGAEKPNALLSRSIAGLSGKSLIFVLPGSVRAVKEYMSEILPMLNHLFAMMSGIDSH